MEWLNSAYVHVLPPLSRLLALSVDPWARHPPRDVVRDVHEEEEDPVILLILLLRHVDVRDVACVLPPLTSRRARISRRPDHDDPRIGSPPDVRVDVGPCRGDC